MWIWSRKRLGAGSVKLMPGWNDVPEEDLDALNDQQAAYLKVCAEEGLVRNTADHETGNPPGETVELSAPAATAADLVKAIRACTSLEELASLDAEDDSRSTVANAFDKKLAELQGEGGDD